MSLRRLQHRVSNVRVISVGWLENYKLEFHKISNDGSGKCDAYYVGNAKHLVYGVVFKLTSSQLRLLDKYEGLGKGYEKKLVQVVTQNLKTISAVTYFATEIDSSIKPYLWYKEHVLRGAKEHSLPKNYIDIIKKIGAAPDPNTKRHQEELMIYQ